MTTSAKYRGEFADRKSRRESRLADLNVAVVDDDPAVAKTIRQWIEQDDPQARVQVYRSGEELLLARRPADIVYLDIRMGGADGIETAKRFHLQQKHALFVFVSGLRDKVFEALDAHPFHFLLKPLDHAQFSSVYAEASATVREREDRGVGQFLLKNRKESRLIPYDEIIYVESRSRKFEVHTPDGIYEMYGALTAVEKELGKRFFRSHRAFLVNMSWISSYGSDTITFRNGESVFLARQKRPAFVKQYMWYLQEAHGAFCRNEN